MRTSRRASCSMRLPWRHWCPAGRGLAGRGHPTWLHGIATQPGPNCGRKEDQHPHPPLAPSSCTFDLFFAWERSPPLLKIGDFVLKAFLNERVPGTPPAPRPPQARPKDERTAAAPTRASQHSRTTTRTSTARKLAREAPTRRASFCDQAAAAVQAAERSCGSACGCQGLGRARYR